jgi:hypothetical protein
MRATNSKVSCNFVSQVIAAVKLQTNFFVVVVVVGAPTLIENQVLDNYALVQPDGISVQRSPLARWEAREHELLPAITGPNSLLSSFYLIMNLPYRIRIADPLDTNLRRISEVTMLVLKGTYMNTRSGAGNE